MIIEELKNHMKNFGFESGGCKKDYIRKGEGYILAYNPKKEIFELYETKNPIALHYQETPTGKDLIVYFFGINSARLEEIMEKSCCVCYEDEIWIKNDYCKNCKC